MARCGELGLALRGWLRGSSSDAMLSVGNEDGPGHEDRLSGEVGLTEVLELSGVVRDE